MRKFLNGSYGTGEKINKNRTIFKYDFVDKTSYDDTKMIYKFKWRFDDYQHGYINIIVQEYPYFIDEASTMNTDADSPKNFKRPLGLYNDKTLRSLYEEMLLGIR